MTFEPGIRRCVLVTGAAGFIGQHVVARIKNGRPPAEVVMLDQRLEDRGGIDLCNAAALHEFVASHDFTHVVHASGGHAHYPEAEQFRLHVSPTRSLVDTLASNGQYVRWINIGSSSQYGRQDHDSTPLLSEEHPDRPLSPYAKSKCRQEQVVRNAAERGYVDPVYLRLFNPIGRGQGEPFLVPNLLKQILSANAEPIYLRVQAPGTVRDFLDARDAAEAVLAVIDTPAASGQKLNVCSGHPTTISDLAKRLAKIAGRSCEVIGSDSDDNGIPYQCGSWWKIHDLCGWAPHYSLDASLTHIWGESPDQAGSGPSLSL